MDMHFVFWGDGSQAAMDLVKAIQVRSTDNFNWTFIALLALVIVGIWIPQWKKKNYNGMAAALAVSGTGDVHRVDVKTLQGKLKDFGAYLPNA